MRNSSSAPTFGRSSNSGPCKRWAACARFTAPWTSEGLIARSAAICAKGGRFDPYPQSFRTTTMSWGLSAMPLLYIRDSRIANEATALSFGTPNTTRLDPHDLIGKCTGTLTGKSLPLEIRILPDIKNLDRPANRQSYRQTNRQDLRGLIAPINWTICGANNSNRANRYHLNGANKH